MPENSQVAAPPEIFALICATAFSIFFGKSAAEEKSEQTTWPLSLRNPVISAWMTFCGGCAGLPASASGMGSAAMPRSRRERNNDFESIKSGFLSCNLHFPKGDPPHRDRRERSKAGGDHPGADFLQAPQADAADRAEVEIEQALELIGTFDRRGAKHIHEDDDAAGPQRHATATQEITVYRRGEVMNDVGEHDDVGGRGRERCAADILPLEANALASVIERHRLVFASIRDSEVEDPGMQAGIAPAERERIEAMAAAKVEQVGCAARDRRSCGDLIDNLARVISLAAVIERPIIGRQSGMEVPEFVVANILLEVHEAQVQLAMKDGPMQRVRRSGRQPAARNRRHEEAAAAAAEILASDESEDELRGGFRSGVAAFGDLLNGERLAFEGMENAERGGGNDGFGEQQGDEGIQQGRGDDADGEGERFGEILRNGSEAHAVFSWTGMAARGPSGPCGSGASLPLYMSERSLSIRRARQAIVTGAAEPGLWETNAQGGLGTCGARGSDV